jgi:hypothetical protein
MTQHNQDFMTNWGERYQSNSLCDINKTIYPKCRREMTRKEREKEIRAGDNITVPKKYIRQA